MNDVNEEQSDPYRTPQAVSPSKSRWLKWGIIGVGIVVVTTSALGFAIYRTTTLFNFQRVRPMDFGAQRSGPPVDMEHGPDRASVSSTETDLSPEP